jgi:hypothetical protein
MCEAAEGIGFGKGTGLGAEATLPDSSAVRIGGGA